METDNNPPTSASTAKPVGDFQHFLSKISEAASRDLGLRALAQVFAEEATKYFSVSGVYCWTVTGDELVALAGAGTPATEFLDSRLNLRQKAAVVDCVRTRQTVVVNDAQDHEFELNARFTVQSLMLTPLLVSGDVVGAVSYVHDTKRDFFTEDAANEAGIVASQLGNLIESTRLRQASKEARRRADVLVHCSQALNAVLDQAAVRKELGDRIAELLRAQVVVQLSRAGEGDPFLLQTVSAATPAIEEAVKAHHANGACGFANAWAARALGKDQPELITLEENGEELPEFLTAGAQMLVAPLATAAHQGAVLVYCGPEHNFDEQEISVLRTIATMGGLALSNAELFAKTKAQAKDVQQLLDISSELGSLGKLDDFLQRFVVRAAEFLGFDRSFIALAHGEKCEIKWLADKGTVHPVNSELPEDVRERVLVKGEVFWTDDARAYPNANLEFVERFRVHQGLSAPLLGSGGKALGLLAVLDRKDAKPISAEDVRRAKALAGGIAAVLEAAQNLHTSQQHQARAENLMSMALELGSSIQLPELVKSITHRAAAILQAGSAALALMRGPFLETVFTLNAPADPERSLQRRLNLALSDLSVQHRSNVVWGEAEDLIGESLAESIGWQDMAVARIVGANGDLIGLLCLANRQASLAEEDQNLLDAVLAHASIALDNSRLFSRITQANAHWIEIFDSISDFIVVHDQNSHVVRINRSFADFIGAHPAKLIGASMKALMAIAQEPTNQPCPFCRGDGEQQDEFMHPVLEQTYLVSTSKIHASATDDTQTIHVLKDITDRREAERRYRELFDNIQEGLFFSTPDGRFIEVNEALVRMLGYASREELLQADIVRQLYASPAQRERFSEGLEAEGTLRNYEEALLKKDGSVIYTLQNAFAVRDAQNRTMQYRGLVLDITDLKNFQSELQRQRDFNLKILNNTQSLILVCDTVGLITYANRRCYETGGYELDELVGRRLSELVAPHGREALEDAVAQTITGMQVDNLELPLLQAQNRLGQFAANLSPMRDEQGQVNSFVVVMTDITDAALLHAKLMHTEKMAAVGQLVSGVAHEVNNPLTAILGFADLLSEQPDMPESARRDLGVIIQEAQRTKVIVQNLLSFARQMPPQHEPVQVNDIIRRTLQLRAYDFANRGVEVVQHLEEAMPEVVGDPHQLQQVFLNIVNNAFDAVTETGRAGRIEISTRVWDGHLEVGFADNGNGIAAPERIFDPFFTTKEVGKGTGLGLSICYGIVREHGGEINCHNRADSKGAVFVVRLPLAENVASISQTKGAMA